MGKAWAGKLDTSETLGSLTEWIRQLGSDDPEAASILWQRFERRLIDHVIYVVGRGPKLDVGEDVVANAVFQSVLKLAQQKRFLNSNRDDFWNALKLIANRRVIDERRRQFRQKRGSGTVITESVIRHSESPPHEFLDGFPSNLIPPELTAIAAERLERISRHLDLNQKTILRLRLEGFTVEEIAHQIQKSIPTVERKLRLLKRIVQSALEAEDASE